jgi:hypothetical protein
VPRDSEPDEGEEILGRQWDPGRNDEAQPRSRFLARAYSARNSAMVLSLDSAITGVAKSGSSGYAMVDTVSVPGVRRGELFTYHCYTTGSSAIGQIGGLGSDGTPEHFEHPRLAWRFDTVAKRIQRIAPDSVYCTEIEPD